MAPFAAFVKITSMAAPFALVRFDPGSRNVLSGVAVQRRVDSIASAAVPKSDE